MKLFSAEEARQCLSGRNVYFGGDSYAEQFFVGMAGEWTPPAPAGFGRQMRSG